MAGLIKFNPKQRKTRDQTMRVVTAAVAGPALMYAGYKFPGSGSTRALLSLLGVALIGANYVTFREVFDGEEEEEEEPLTEEERSDLGLGLTG
jgi:hypothetical protein